MASIVPLLLEELAFDLTKTINDYSLPSRVHGQLTGRQQNK
jgi:hypothetical protein